MKLFLVGVICFVLGAAFGVLLLCAVFKIILDTLEKEGR